jgi:multidrug resistance efflux pump
MNKLSTTVKKIKGKRDWVKNAIIIFLALLLVLTFFSNTIMNYSLPEVAAQYPMSTTITTKIRGSGTVEAAQTYNVTVQETRTVATVDVKAGDTVAAGDTLLTLDETESQELTDARTTYSSLKLEYDKMCVEKGAQANASAAALQQAQEAVSTAQSDLEKAQKYESNIKSYQSQEASAQSTVNSKQQVLDNVNTQLALLENEKNTITTTNRDYLDADAACTTAQSQLGTAQTDLEKAQSALADLQTQVPQEMAAPETSTEESSETTQASTDTLTQEIAAAEQQVAEAQSRVTAAQNQLDTAQSTRDQLLRDLTLDVDQRIAAKTTEQINAQAAVTSAQNALTAAQTATSQYQSSYTGPTSADSAEDALQAAKDALTNMEATAADTQEQKNYDDTTALLDLKAKEEEVQKALEKVQELESKTAAAKIVSRYAGVVKEVNVAAGDTTSGDTPLMVVELTEKGYTLTATVTKDQAKTLREGLTAEITNLWNSDLTVTLTSISADKSDPANSRALTFAVQGEDVTVGQQLSFSIGDKNASYDVVVPSSAVHTDSDGSFVYTVAVKSSPLGNRYTVQKTSVTVLASDDSNSAVTGELSTADFVITTATVPLQAGDQIRIAE